MDDQLEFLLYCKDDRDAVFAFLRSVYPRDYAERVIRQWDWKYDANPFKQTPEPHVTLLKDGARVIGLYGRFALPFYIEGRERWGSLGGDWVVHPEYRDRRLSRRLWEAYRQPHIALHFSWQNEESVRRRGRHEDVNRVQLAPLVKPIDFGHLVHQLSGRAWARHPVNLAAAGLRTIARPLRRCVAVDGVTISRIEGFDERFDALAWRARGDYPVMVARGERYLNWRFVERPDARYTVLAATNRSELLGYVVLRSAEKEDGRWGHLVDFLVAEHSVSIIAQLMDAGIEHLRRDGVKAISCRAVVPPYRQALYRCGFYVVQWGPRGYLAAWPKEGDPDYAVFRDVRKWFVTMGDGDLELDF
jgi:hypothetical protein